jgi:Peptidase family S51
MSTVVLLGPQSARSDVGAVLAELGIRGKVALVTAGHQEAESDDAAIVAALAVPAVNLRLHARATEVFAADPELATAYHARQDRFRNIQAFYRIRLEKTDEAARMISVRYVEPDLLEQEDKVSVDQLRQLDDDHVQRCTAIRTAFHNRWRVGERPAVAKHRSELRELIAECDAVVVAGGHVASLYNRMKMFDLLGVAAGKPIVAWSAGAMVLTDRIVLFHDYPPYGSDIAQVLEAGFGCAPGIVVLPDPRRRVRLDDRPGIARFARRMLPAACVGMDHGTRLVFEHGRLARVAAARFAATGDVDYAWSGA